jgi:hypothetical protein
VSFIFTVVKSKKVGWMGHVAHWGEKKNEYGVLVGKPEGKRSRGYD